jgi:hypothetical protein
LAANFKHSSAFRRVAKEAVFTSVAGQSRWFENKGISQVMQTAIQAL